MGDKDSGRRERGNRSWNVIYERKILKEKNLRSEEPISLSIL